MTRITWFMVPLLASLSGLAAAQPATPALLLMSKLDVRDPAMPERWLGPLPLVDEHLRAEVDGQFATSTLRQVFHNRTAETLEGRYTLQASRGARVSAFAYYIGEERIDGEVLERQAARRVYQQVTEQRRDPAILEQNEDGSYTFRVFPIQPREDKRVEITTSEWLSRRGGTVTYRAPTSSAAQIEVLIRDPRIAQLRSPSHSLTVEPTADGVRVRAHAIGAETGELVMRWEIEEAPFEPSLFVHQDEGHDGYFLLSLAAPRGMEDHVTPKDVTLVLDRSGSMAGEPIAQARDAAAGIIERLGSRDRVNVIAFDDDVDPLFHRPQATAGAAREEALNFVGRLRSGGGTDIAFALRRALEAQHGDSAGRPQVVIFLTDGRSDPEAALALAARNADDARVFTVGVGPGVNQALLSRLAAVKRGTFTYIDDANELEREMGHLYSQIARPLLVDVSLEVEGAVASRIYPRTLSDLFVDGELLVAGRFRRTGGPMRFVLRGRVDDEQVVMVASSPVGDKDRRPWVGRRWAVERVDHLLEEIELRGERPELRAEVLSLALAYRFVTPYTAFLAIPAREVTAAAAQTLAAARDQQAGAQARHADAVALQASAGPPGDFESYSVGPTELDVEEIAMDSTRAGCASCAVGARRPPPGSLFVGGLLIGLALLRRRG